MYFGPVTELCQRLDGCGVPVSRVYDDYDYSIMFIRMLSVCCLHLGWIVYMCLLNSDVISCCYHAIYNYDCATFNPTNRKRLKTPIKSSASLTVLAER